jgi:hypothetical protein
MSNLKLPNVACHADALRVATGPNANAYYRTSFIANRDGSVSIHHYQTEIIRYEVDGSIVLNNGGWVTSTTTNRLNSLTPAWLHVFRRNFEQWVDLGQGSYPIQRTVTITA